MFDIEISRRRKEEGIEMISSGRVQPSFICKLEPPVRDRLLVGRRGSELN